MNWRLGVVPSILVGSFALAAVADAQPYTRHTKMGVAEHASLADVPDQVYDAAFAMASSALQIDVGDNDVACPLTLSRNGAVARFAISGHDANIDSEAELRSTQGSSNGYLIVVNQINWCGQIGPAAGCGWPRGQWRPFLVTRAGMTGPTNGLLLAHEFGHTMGLFHENSPPQQIMNASIYPEHTKVLDNAMCLKFRQYLGSACNVHPRTCSVWSGESSPTASLMALSMESQAAARPPMSMEPVFTRVPIEELAHQELVNGPPVEVEDYYGESDLDALMKMLRDPALSTHRRTIVTLIGLLSDGSAEDVRALTNYATQQDADAAAAAMALGYVVNRTGSLEALEFLLKHRTSPDERIATGAILGLALSGHARALAALQEPSLRRAHAREFLESAARENRKIASGGLRDYYRRHEIDED